MKSNNSKQALADNKNNRQLLPTLLFFLSQPRKENWISAQHQFHALWDSMASHHPDNPATDWVCLQLAVVHEVLQSQEPNIISVISSC